MTMTTILPEVQKAPTSLSTKALMRFDCAGRKFVVRRDANGFAIYADDVRLVVVPAKYLHSTLCAVL